MNQQRLDIIPRKISRDEGSLRRELREILSEINRIEKLRVSERKRLKRQQAQQAEHGLELGEITITDQLIAKRMADLRVTVVSLTRKYEKVHEQLIRCTEFNQNQQTLNP